MLYCIFVYITTSYIYQKVVGELYSRIIQNIIFSHKKITKGTKYIRKCRVKLEIDHLSDRLFSKDVDKTDDYGNTALLLAAEKGFLGVAELLLGTSLLYLDGWMDGFNFIQVENFVYLSMS